MTAPVITRVKTRGAARQVLKCKDPQVLICGAAGTGKSFTALWKVHLMCMRNPGMRALVVRKTHKSLTATGLVTFREKVAKEAIAAGICKWYGGSSEKPAMYIYPHSNGDESVIVVGGLDQADKIMSSEYDMIFVQEATECTPDDIEKLDSRCRNGMVSFQQLLMDCNPQQPTHHLKKRCDDGRTTMLYAHHTDNPRLYEEKRDDAGRMSLELTEYGRAYLARLDNLTGVRKLRLRDGLWVAAEGMIYTDWRPDVHITDRKILPQSWKRLWAVDFGYTHPFVWQQWAVDEDGRLWLELEIFKTKTLVEDHARAILRAVTVQTGENAGQPKYPRPSAIICDHDAEDRATLERHLGMGTQPAWKGVSDGIQAVQARMRDAGDGKPRLFILRGSLVERDALLVEANRPTCLLDEIEGYIWKPGADGRPIPDEPYKNEDDAMDTMRYVVAHEDLAPRPRLRWVA